MIVTIETPAHTFHEKWIEPLKELKKENPEWELTVMDVEVYKIPFWDPELWKLMWWASLIGVCQLVVPKLKREGPIITFRF